MSKNNREARFSHTDLKFGARGFDPLGLSGISRKY